MPHHCQHRKISKTRDGASASAVLLRFTTQLRNQGAVAWVGFSTSGEFGRKFNTADRERDLRLATTALHRSCNLQRTRCNNHVHVTPRAISKNTHTRKYACKSCPAQPEPVAKCADVDVDVVVVVFVDVVNIVVGHMTTLLSLLSWPSRALLEPFSENTRHEIDDGDQESARNKDNCANVIDVCGCFSCVAGWWCDHIITISAAVLTAALSKACLNVTFSAV